MGTAAPGDLHGLLDWFSYTGPESTSPGRVMGRSSTSGGLREARAFGRHRDLVRASREE